MKIGSVSAALGVAAGIAAGVAVWGAVYPSSQVFGPTLRRTRRKSEIALTFDDGPNPAVTPRLLSLLEKRGVRATFFLVGRFAKLCPRLVREIAERGHAIGNHSETHRNLALLSSTHIVNELSRCQESIGEALHAGVCRSPVEAPRWMRPPFGFRGPQLAKAVGRAGLRGVAMWSLTCYDWKPQPRTRLIERLGCVSVARPACRGGEIVLLHDGDFRALGGDRLHVLTALEYWLPRWQDAGFEFVTIDEVAGVVRTGA